MIVNDRSFKVKHSGSTWREIKPMSFSCSCKCLQVRPECNDDHCLILLLHVITSGYLIDLNWLIMIMFEALITMKHLSLFNYYESSNHDNQHLSTLSSAIVHHSSFIQPQPEPWPNQAWPNPVQPSQPVNAMPWALFDSAAHSQRASATSSTRHTEPWVGRSVGKSWNVASFAHLLDVAVQFGSWLYTLDERQIAHATEEHHVIIAWNASQWLRVTSNREAMPCVMYDTWRNRWNRYNIYMIEARWCGVRNVICCTS